MNVTLWDGKFRWLAFSVNDISMGSLLSRQLEKFSGVYECWMYTVCIAIVVRTNTQKPPNAHRPTNNHSSTHTHTHTNTHTHTHTHIHTHNHTHINTHAHTQDAISDFSKSLLAGWLITATAQKLCEFFANSTDSMNVISVTKNYKNSWVKVMKNQV